MIRQWISVLGFLLVSLALLGACGSEGDTSVAPSEAAHDHAHTHKSSNMMMSIPLEDADLIIEIEFRNGIVITNENRVFIRNGETALFAVFSDVDEVIHIHGVDLVGEILSGDSKNYFGFTITASGIFEVEFENSGTFVTEILVS